MAAVLDSVRALFAPKTETAFRIDRENPGDVLARERLLDDAMGPNRRKKSSEAIRRDRIPAEGLALVARDAAGHVIGTVRLWNIQAGVSPEVIVIDPGLGFGKSIAQNYELAARLGELQRDLGQPALSAASRKSFLAHRPGESEAPGGSVPPRDRLGAGVAMTIASLRSSNQKCFW